MAPAGKGQAPAIDGDDGGAIEEIEVRGHIIDSLLLPKILDRILQMGGTFEIRECRIGSRRVDPSYARVAVKAGSPEALAEVGGDHVGNGAHPVATGDAGGGPAHIAGAFPEGFYSTTNQQTQVRVAGQWIDVANQEMDCSIAVDPARRTARCVAMTDVAVGMPIVVGHSGVRVIPVERP